MTRPDPAAALREVREALEFYMKLERVAGDVEKLSADKCPAARALSLLDALEPETWSIVEEDRRGAYVSKSEQPGCEPVAVLRRREEGV